MKMSPELDKLLSALSKVQGVIKNPEKTKYGYKNAYKYAELSGFISVSQSLLEEHGLSIIQFPGELKIVEITEKSTVYDNKAPITTYRNVLVPLQSLTTFIGHESGQFISLPMDILADKTAGMSLAQSIGAVITFARRYARAGVLGVVGEDDTDAVIKDDEPENKPSTYSRTTYTTSTIPLTQKSDYARITPDQIAHLKSLVPDTRINAYVKNNGLARVEDLTQAQYQLMVDTVRSETQKVG